MSDGSFSMSSNSVAGSDHPVDLAVEAARQGATDAKLAAERFADSAGLFMARFVYTTCYTISYGLVFPTVMIARSVPRSNAAVRGLLDGAAAAAQRADEFLGESLSPPTILALPGVHSGPTI